MVKLPKFIDRDDVPKMLSFINRKCPTGCRNYAALISMYRAGLRVQEVCNLATADINFKSRFIYVQQGKGKKDRYLPMDDDMIQSAKHWVDMKESRGIRSDYFFCTLEGGQLDQRYLREVCYRIARKADVFIQDGKDKKNPSPHKFRHSFATELLEDGFNPREVQELLGHSSLNTTMVYTHIVQGKLADKIKNRGPIAAQ